MAEDTQKEQKNNSSLVDKGIDLIKWVDSPFKLLEVIILATLAFGGYFAWDSRQVILQAITSHDNNPQLKAQDELLPIVQSLMKDVGAVVVVVNKANLVINSRTTVLAVSNTGREKELEGTVTSLFNASPERNRAMVAMLNGEVLCEKFDPSSKIGEWGVKQGVEYMCRGSIPPDIGQFAGYVSVGFKDKVTDEYALKTRINLAASEMAK